jgi:hypothetical protein
MMMQAYPDLTAIEAKLTTTGALELSDRGLWGLPEGLGALAGPPLGLSYQWGPAQQGTARAALAGLATLSDSDPPDFHARSGAGCLPTAPSADRA